MLEHIFGSKTRLKLLYLFFSFPERAFFGRELARQTEMQLNAVRRELMNLEKIGLIRQVTASEAKNEEPGTERSKFYALDKSFALYEELKALLLKAHLYAEQELIDRLKTKSGSVRLLILSGFFSGELDAPTDILIVGSLKPMVVARIIRDLEKMVGRSLRYTLMEEREFRERKEIGDKFLYALFETKHHVIHDSFGLA